MKKYLIKNDLDFEKISIATLKKVYSATLFPRVISNIKNMTFKKNFAKNIDFECFFEQNLRIFAKKVHFFDFDLGLFFFEKHKKTYLVLVDGNGRCAGKTVTNFFDNVFAMDFVQFEKIKSQVKFEYKKLASKKLLIEEFDKK